MAMYTNADSTVKAKAKYEFIRMHSGRCVVVCGPSGVGKTMSIDFMAQSYMFHHERGRYCFREVKAI